MSACKYIAAGFMNDVTKLFNDFAKCRDLDFKTFSNVWKENKFFHVFMGRPDDKEFREFVNEIYQLILDYLMSSSTESQIASIYLLYALFRNQDFTEPIRIRITQTQYQVFKNIRAFAMNKKIWSLLYVLDYLNKNCFVFIANGCLLGPCCSQNKDSYMKPKAEQVGILSDLKQDITLFQESNIFQNLKKIRSLYIKKRESIMSASTNDKGTTEVIKRYEKLNIDLEALALGCRRTTVRNVDNSVDIGSRRAQLKKNSFKKRALFRYLNYEEEPLEETEKTEIVPIKKRRQYKKRTPVNERRVGRPKKLPTPDSSDESESVPEVPAEPVPTKKGKRGPIGRKRVSYLKCYEGPAILETPKEEPLDEDDLSSFSDESFPVDDLEF